jgi:rhomboid protease GluP
MNATNAGVTQISPRQSFPLLTALTLGVTAVLTASRLVGDGVLDAVRRDPAALGHGQLWRLVSPVLVQGDRSLFAVLGVFALCSVIGATGERILPRRRWIALYFIGALAGHSAGEVFQPHQSGSSVAFAGILGGLAAYALFGCAPVLQDWRTRAAVAIPLAVLDTVFRDIHGVAFLAGLLATSAWVLRDRTWEKDTAACRPAGPPVSSATPNGR